MTGERDSSKSQIAFKKLAKTSPVAITEVGKHGNIVYANSRAEEVLGLEKSEITDRTYDDPGWRITDFEGNDFPAEKLPFQIVKETGEPVYNVRHAIEWPEGERKLLSVNASPSFNEDGEFDGIVAVIEDITEQFRNKRRLEENKKRYRQLFTETNEGVALHELIYDDEGNPVDYRVLEVNPNFESIIGLAKEEVQGKKASEVYDQENPPYLNQYSEVVTTGKPTSFETYYEPLGKHFKISAFSPEKDKFATMFTDITDLKKAKEELEESEQRYRRLFETAQDGMLILNADTGEIIDANPYIRDLLGFSKEELAGKRLWQIGTFQDVVENRDKFQKLVEKGYIRYEHLSLKTKSGEATSVELVSNTYKVNNQNIVQCSIRDVTERTRIQDQKDHLTSVIRSVRKVNQLLVREDNRGKIIQAVCDILTDKRDYFNAWVALFDESENLLETAQSGIGEEFDPMVELLKNGQFPRRVKKTLETDGVIITDNPPETCDDCPLSINYEKRNSITTRLEYNGKVYGMLSASAPEQFAEDDQERHLIEEVAGDIALGLHNVEVEEELKKSKDRYQKYFEKTGDAIFILKMGGEEQGKILEVNPKASEQTGYSRDELIGMNLLDEVVIGEPIDMDYEKIDEQLSRGETVKFTEKKRRKNGTVYWTEVVVTPLKHEGKRANLSINRDITQRREAEQALRESEEKFRQIVEQTHDGIYIYRDEKFLFVNDRASEISGYSKDELYDMNVWTLIHPQDRETGKEMARKRKLGEDVPSTFESRIIRKDEEVRYGEFSVTTLNYQGEYANLGTVRDITNIRKANEKLKESFIELAETTSRVLGVRDPYTQKHEQRVAELSREVGRRMDLNEDKLLGLYLGGILHDIGKIAIPETILTKPGDLKEVEWQMIRSHPEVGYDQILEDTDFPWPVAEMTLHHHERLDGSGYPDGLEGEELTREVRILGAVDVVEAMSTRRPYRSARSKEETLKEIEKGKGNRYDPEVVEILVRMIEEGEIQFG